MLSDAETKYRMNFLTLKTFKKWLYTLCPTSKEVTVHPMISWLKSKIVAINPTRRSGKYTRGRVNMLDFRPVPSPDKWGGLLRRRKKGRAS